MRVLGKRREKKQKQIAESESFVLDKMFYFSVKIRLMTDERNCYRDKELQFTRKKRNMKKYE
jgi:hypothetical protein